MESDRTSGGRGIVWALLIGVGLGIVGTLTVPVYVKPLLPSLFRGPVAVEGKVLEKEQERDRLVLKVVTEEGVVLATFTEQQKEIALLVDIGDTLVMDVGTYEPFLQNPVVRRVRKPDGWQDEQLREVPVEPSEPSEPSEPGKNDTLTPPVTDDRKEPSVSQGPATQSLPRALVP